MRDDSARRRGPLGDTWHLDELFVAINGRKQYLWRAVDQDGDVLDILVQSRRNRRAGRPVLSTAAQEARASPPTGWSPTDSAAIPPPIGP